MRAFGIIISACLILAVIKSAIIALLLVFAILLLFAVLFQPRETFGMVFMLGGWAFLNQHPMAAVISLAIIGLAAAIGHLAKGEDGHLRTGGHENDPASTTVADRKSVSHENETRTNAEVDA